METKPTENHHPHDDESQHQKRPDPSYLPRKSSTKRCSTHATPKKVWKQENQRARCRTASALETRARPPYDKERWRQKLKHFCSASIRGLQITSLKSLFPINPENLDLRGRPNNIKRSASQYDHATPPATRPCT